MKLKFKRVSDIRHLVLGAAVVLSGQLALAVDEETEATFDLGILPSQKQGVEVDREERNPFANRVVKKVTIEDTETEAAHIRRVLSNLEVVGVSKGPRGTRVLLGDLLLMEGKELPPVVTGQSDRVVVSAVSETEVELTWIVESGKAVEDGRQLIVPFNLEPKVEVVLPGQFNILEEAKKKRDWARLERAIKPSSVASSAGPLGNQP